MNCQQCRKKAVTILVCGCLNYHIISMKLCYSCSNLAEIRLTYNNLLRKYRARGEKVKKTFNCHCGEPYLEWILDDEM